MKKKSRNTLFARPMGIIAVAAAAGLASVLIAAAQTAPPVPPCDRFDDPNCHPSAPIVVKRPSQTIEGGLNVTGQLCAGVGGANPHCIPGPVQNAGAVGVVNASTVTLYRYPISIPESVWPRGTKTRLNVRNFLTAANADPGPITGVLLSAQVGSVKYGPFLSSSGWGPIVPSLGPTFVAANADADVNGFVDTNRGLFQLNSTQWQGSCVVTESGNYCTQYLSGDVGTTAVSLSSAGEMWLGFTDERMPGVGVQAPAAVHIVGYYH